MPVKDLKDFTRLIAQTLDFKEQAILEWFSIEETKDGYFTAVLQKGKWLDDLPFKAVCGLIRDLKGDYVKGAKTFWAPGPLAKKSPTPIQGEIPKAVTGSEQTRKEPSASTEQIPKPPMESDEEYDLKASKDKIGALYPVLTDSFGTIIDGFHRLAKDPTWPKLKIDYISDPVQVEMARLAANLRRKVPEEEKALRLRNIASMTGWSPKQIAENLGVKYGWVVHYLSDDFKNQEKAEAGKVGGMESGASRREADMDKPVSLETVKPQDVTVGKAKEILDTPAGREVLIDAVKEAMDKGEIPASLDKEEPLFAEGIQTTGDSEKPGVGSSESVGVAAPSPVHRHKLEGTQVGEFTCTECNQHFFIDHISPEKHRLTKVRSAPE